MLAVIKYRWQHATAPLRRRVEQAWQALRESSRYHGMWAPGVLLMRNLPLGKKAAMVLACLAVPFSMLLWQVVSASLRDIRLADVAVQGVGHFQKVSALEQETLTAVRSVYLEERGQRPAGSVTKSLQAERARHDTVADALQGEPAHTRIARAWVQVEERRTRMYATLGAHGRPDVDAMRAYAREVAQLKAELVPKWGPEVKGAPGPVAIRNGVAYLLSRLVPLMHRITGQGGRLYDAADPVRAGHELGQLAAEAGLLIDMARPQFESAVNFGAIQGARVDDTFAAARRLVDAARCLSVPRAAAANSIAAACGLEASQYVAIGTEAVRLASDLEDGSVAMLSTTLQQRQTRLKVEFAAQVAVWVIALLLAGYLLVAGYKVVGGGLRILAAHLERMAHGEFGTRSPGLGSDEVGRALDSLAQTTAHMSRLLGAVTQGVSAVSHASREVAIGNAGLSGRTQDMRSAIVDVAGRTQSFTVALEACAEQIEQVAEHVHAISGNAQRSREAVVGLRSRMRSLQAKSREISQVVGLVEAVAHQTKLLSLNASVEAARAGEAGKGFAVVAAEVRALAQRSENAALRIHGIVSASVSEIEDGNLLADRASDAVHATDEKVRTVGGLVREVVQLTQTGMLDTQQVLAIARSLEASTSGNAQVVEQLSDAAAALRGQGESLKRSVQHFVFQS